LDPNSNISKRFFNIEDREFVYSFAHVFWEKHRIFARILSQMYFWRRKSALNYESRPDTDPASVPDSRRRMSTLRSPYVPVCLYIVSCSGDCSCDVEVCMGMEIPIPIEFPWDFHGNRSSSGLLMGMGMRIVLMGMEIAYFIVEK